MKNDLISVVIPVYNVVDYLDKCLSSVINQTYENLEIILVDDGSTDSSGKICDTYSKADSRIVSLHKSNGGLSDARNYGIERAHGKYITFIDSDDYIDLDCVEYLYNLIQKYQTLMSVCQHRVIFSNGKIEDYGSLSDECLNAHDALERMLYHDVIDTSAWAKLYNRTLFKDICYPKGKVFEDIGTTYKFFIESKNIAIGYKSKYNYIMRNSSISRNSFSPSKFDLLEMTDKMATDVLKCYPDLDGAVLRRRVYARFSTLNNMLDISSYQDERNEIIKFIKGHKKEILNDPKTPKRDIIAIRLLSISFNLYRFVWKKYKKER